MLKGLLIHRWQAFHVILYTVQEAVTKYYRPTNCSRPWILLRDECHNRCKQYCGPVGPHDMRLSLQCKDCVHLLSEVRMAVC